MLQKNWTELKSMIKQYALIGIGISLTFMLSSVGLTFEIKTWLAYIIFGSLVGIFIGLANEKLELIFHQRLPQSGAYILLKLSLVYLISCLIFYLTGLTFSLLVALSREYLLYISLAVGIPSTMINLFFTFLEEKETKIKLEQKNKELAIIEERNRIARELHDSVAQNLFGISLNLETLEQILTTNPQQAPQIIEQLQDMVEEVQTEMRLMIYELKPLTFQERSFLEAVNNLLNLFEKRYNLNLTFNANQQEVEFNQQVKLNLYRIIQEALHNIVQHAQAEKVEVKLQVADKIKLIIADDGIGFDQEEVNSQNKFGLANIKERAAAINGEVTINSQPQEGTTIICTTAGDSNETGI